MNSRDPRAQRLIDIGSTTALSAMVEIVEKQAKANAPGILARQVRAMFARLDGAEDRDIAIEAFCDEVESFFESVPGVQARAQVRPARRASGAAGR